MIIQTEGSDYTAMFGTPNPTPAHTHMQTTDFSAILNDLRDGKIPSGTGHIFDVNWANDTNVPWDPNEGIYNPFARL
ncbi:MAG: hypothetical protein IKA36_04945 [Clostridia bacterium]|nr:hypothetical protein [Clostridia bacterium]